MVRTTFLVASCVMLLIAACVASSDPTPQSGPAEDLSKTMDHHLVSRYSDYLRNADAADESQELVLVDASASADGMVLAADLKRLGAMNVNVAGLIVSARIPVASLYAVSQLQSLRFCRMSLRATR